MRGRMRRGTFEHRSGRVIALGRVAIAAIILVAIWMDPSQPSNYPQSAYALLAVYLAAAVGHLGATWRNWWLESRLALPAHAADILLFTLMVFLTDGYTSPFYTFFVFLLLSATIKWGWRETALTAILVVILFYLAGLAALYWAHGGFEFSRFFVRGAYLAVLSIILIWFGVNQPGQRVGPGFDLDLIDPEKPAEPPMLAGARLVAGSLGARRVIALWWEKEEPWVNAASYHEGAASLIVSRHGPDAFGDIVADEVQGRTFLFDVNSKRMLLETDGQICARRAGGSMISPALMDCFGFASGLAIPLESDLQAGLLLALDADGLSADDIFVGQRCGALISSAMGRAALTALAAENVGAVTRLAVARDLHDSVAQLLAGLSLRLEGLRKSRGRNEDVAPLIAALQQDLANEKRDLRTLIAKLRGEPHLPVSDAAAELGELAERLSRHWGVFCTLRRCPADAALSGPVRHEIQQLIREAVANAARHGKAKRIAISVEREGGDILLEIEDDGAGFPDRETGDPGDSRVTPRSLKERVDHLGGRLSVRTADRGSRIMISLPLEDV